MRFAYVEVKRRRCVPSEEDMSNVAACVELRRRDAVAASLGGRVYWLSKDIYDVAKNLLGVSAYRGYEGASFGVAGGVWLVEGEPEPAGPGRVLVETRWGRENGPFEVEEDFVFRGFFGRDIEVGRVVRHRYFLAPYRRDGTPLTLPELRRTLLWRNYLSSVQRALQRSSRHGKREWWHIERMRPEAVGRFKVVWRDVADRFVPAVEPTGAVPEHSAHYVVVDTLEETYYLLAVLLAPQINAVVKEISAWVGHVEPSFITYFDIPKYNPACGTHRRLALIGEEVHRGGIDDETVKRVQTLAKGLKCR
jgi:hypothetical protein